MAKKKKFYVVWKGHEPGVYTSWNACKKQVTGFAGAKYKSYSTEEEAERAFNTPFEVELQKPKSQSKPDLNKFKDEIIKDSIAVDAACAGNPGKLEYQGVDTFSKIQLFHVGPLEEGTNNVGEFLAIVHALALLKKSNRHDTVIYTDSRTAMAWIRKKHANTKLKRTSKNAKLFVMLERATDWLHANTWTNKIEKWDTSRLGEIPADFGRK